MGGEEPVQEQKPNLPVGPRPAAQSRTLIFSGLGECPRGWANWRESCQQEWPGAAEREHAPVAPALTSAGDIEELVAGERRQERAGCPLRVLPLHLTGEAGDGWLTLSQNMGGHRGMTQNIH